MSIKWANIALIGMRCTGKSGIGKEVARKLGWEFVDLDEEIIAFCGKTIDEITKSGQNWHDFREIETKILEKLLLREKCVISCGGGVGVNDIVSKNGDEYGEIQAQILKNADKTFKILLHSDINVIIKRFKNDVKNLANRPILSSKTNFEEDLVMQNFYRTPKYKKIAHTIVETSDAEWNFSKIIAEIIQKTSIKTNAVIGHPVKHSMSPHIHQACYQKLAIKSEFSFIHLEIKPMEIEKLRDYILQYNLWGISVTTPHKDAVMKICDKIDDFAKKCNAVNTIVRTAKNELIGYNTDYIGVFNSLPSEIEGKKIAILGAGGAARACLVALEKHAINTTVFVRDARKSSDLIDSFSVQIANIADFNADFFDIIINATSCGHKSEECPIDTSKISDKHTVFDLIYSPLYTKLLCDSQKNGAKIILGTQMLINQAMRQFELYTGYFADFKTMESAINTEILRQNEVSKMLSRIFVSIFGHGVEEIAKKLDLIDKNAQNIEIRADYIENLSLFDIENLAQIMSKYRTIFTARKKEHGGNGRFKNYDEIMKKAASLFDFIDIDVSDFALMGDLSSQKAKIIASYHDFNDMISQEKLDEIYENCKKADIIKIAITPQSTKDCIKCLSLLEKYDNLAIIAMGENCKSMRIDALKYGSKLAFAAAFESEKTAPGQVTLNDYVIY
ncbi:shikimate dehydrogenase [Candidatus Deianiraea vastatrix]|uniref:Multifunctional fusion protein n=1 Tax=Candidatus Deianiraea vastatrix TaxID=2163644 RepID=A0A5B8XEB8_9RICK|nr:shikimate dehydrogenase [Candidatus Deianiraea vastatrix]QED23225.1 fused shikimate kinase + shikimate dehydrogenase + 3-dehydroquinate dehydratase [Candidatus Deianiraea vastatrix]